VILAAGGYNYNLELFGRFRPIVKKAYPELVRGGTMGCDSGNIELGVAPVAASRMERMFVTKGISPPEPYVAGVLINADGKRTSPRTRTWATSDARLPSNPRGSRMADPRFADVLEGHPRAAQPLRNAVSWWGMPGC
jgi:hypothetical protein